MIPLLLAQKHTITVKRGVQTFRQKRLAAVRSARACDPRTPRTTTAAFLTKIRSRTGTFTLLYVGMPCKVRVTVSNRSIVNGEQKRRRPGLAL